MQVQSNTVSEAGPEVGLGALKVILRGPWEFSGTSLRAPGGLLGILGVPLAGLVTSEGLWVWVIWGP